MHIVRLKFFETTQTKPVCRDVIEVDAGRKRFLFRNLLNAEELASNTIASESRHRFSRFKRHFAKQFKKCLRGAMEPFAAAMNDPERAKETGARERDWYHATLGNIGVHDAGRHNAHAGAVRHRFLNHLKVVEMKNRVDHRAVIAKEPIDIALDGKILIETDKFHAVEIRRRH